MIKCIDKAAIENILHKLWKKDTGFENIDIAIIAYNRALQDVQKAIDSKQEEPVSIWHDVSEEPKEGFTIVVYMKDDSLKVLTSWGENGDFCIGEGFWYNIHQQRKWAYVDDLLNLSNVERTVKDRKEKSVSEELGEIILEGANFNKSWYAHPELAFKAGANWQKEQFEKNRLAHCDALTEEQTQMECDFVVQHVKKNNRTPTFIDAIEYGKRLQKQQMMAKAINTKASLIMSVPSICISLPLGVNVGDKVKVIVIKEE